MMNLFRRHRQPDAVAIAPEPIANDPVVVVAPCPSPEEPELRANELAEYRTVAAALGLESHGAVLAECFEHFLHDNVIPTYDTDDVVAYLDRQLGKDWVFAGLRQCDVDHLGGWATTVGGRSIEFSATQYDDAVPLPVLLTVQKIASAFPELHFYITKPKDGDGDPFLNVTCKGVSNYIIERWDEPSFR